MSRPASGDDAVLTKARRAIASAQTVEQLRQALAVALPLVYQMSMADTAQMIGVSRGWACQLRRRFILGQIAGAPNAPTAGGRKRQNMTLQEELEFLAPFVSSAVAGNALVVSQIKAALDKQLGREVALSSAYNLLHRHDLKRFSPDKCHRQGDSAPLDESKVNAPKRLPKSVSIGARAKP